MRRICCFCESWESGGIESFLHNILLRMDLTGLEVDIVAAQLKDSVFTQALREHGVRFRELSGSQRNLPENHRRFAALLWERRYDVVHLNIFQGMSLYYAHLAKRAGVPVRIAHSHNTDLRQSLTRPLKLWLHRRYSQRCAADATALWACSERAARFLFPTELLARCGFTFIPNGIDTERFRFHAAVREDVRRELGLTDQFVIGNIGRLCQQKNQSFLLDVLAQGAKLRPDLRLLLIGEGGDLDALKEKAERLGLTDRVLFYGTTKHPERLLWAMDVFAFPSLFEGLGIVAIEAQAAGLPVVCSEHVPPEAAVTPLVTRLPLDEGAAAWANALLKLPETEQTSGAEQVRQGGFDVADVARRIERTYMGSEHGETNDFRRHSGV